MQRAHTISWVRFAVLAAGTILLSLVSLSAAYLNPGHDLIANRFTPAEVANGDEELAAALSARRGTAASFSLSYGILVLGAALAYRKDRRRAFGWIVGRGWRTPSSSCCGCHCLASVTA